MWEMNVGVSADELRCVDGVWVLVLVFSKFCWYSVRSLTLWDADSSSRFSSANFLYRRWNTSQNWSSCKTTVYNVHLICWVSNLNTLMSNIGKHQRFISEQYANISVVNVKVLNIKLKNQIIATIMHLIPCLLKSYYRFIWEPNWNSCNYSVKILTSVLGLFGKFISVHVRIRFMNESVK